MPQLLMDDSDDSIWQMHLNNIKFSSVTQASEVTWGAPPPFWEGEFTEICKENLWLKNWIYY